MAALGTHSRPPGYELFFAPLEVSLNPSEFEACSFAYIASKFGHAKQVRDDGSRYFDHLKGATWIYIDELGGRDPRSIKGILLHDIREDSYLLSLYRIGLNFGADVALDVRAMTKLPKGKESTSQYLGRVIDRGPWAILGKLCDRLHNNRSLESCSVEKRLRQISETHEYHLPMLIPALHKHGGVWMQHSDALEKKISSALSTYKT